MVQTARPLKERDIGQMPAPPLTRAQRPTVYHVYNVYHVYGPTRERPRFAHRTDASDTFRPNDFPIPTTRQRVYSSLKEKFNQKNTYKEYCSKYIYIHIHIKNETYIWTTKYKFYYRQDLKFLHSLNFFTRFFNNNIDILCIRSIVFIHIRIAKRSLKVNSSN